MIEGSPRNPFDKTPSAVVYKPKAIYYGCEMDLSHTIPTSVFGTTK